MNRIKDILNIEKLNLSEIMVTYKIPAPKVFSPPQGLGRYKSGLIYMLKEKCLYEFDEESFVVGEGELVYVPEGAKYKCTHLSQPKDARYYVVDFRLYDFSGKLVNLSSKPFKIDVSSFDNIKSLFDKLYDNYNTYDFANHLYMKSVLFEILYTVSKCTVLNYNNETGLDNMRKAMNIIGNHYMEDISTKELAKLFNMSCSHFRKQFVKAAGYSPVVYRNRIRIHKAYEFISSGGMSIKEAADAVGFCDVYYFSTMFKKVMGVSPGKVKK